MPGNEDITPEYRRTIASKEAYLSTGLNVALFIIKISLALVISSIALTADAFHTLSDISTSLVILFSFRAATKQPDEEHPYGHGRWEPIGTLIISVMLVVAGIELLFKGIEAGYSGSHGEANIMVAGIVMLTAGAKEGLARWAIKLGNEIDSPALIADAWHHRTDAISSMGVAFAIAFADRFGAIDGIAAVIVSLLIIKTGIDFIRSTSTVLLGRAPSPENLIRIETLVSGIHGVKDVHGIHIHDYHAMRAITLHITTDGDMKLADAHAIADMVEKKVGDSLRAEVTVHVEPSGQ